MPPRKRAALLPLIFLASLPACGGPSNVVSVKGRLLKGGAAYAAPEGHQVALTFVGIEIEDPTGRAVKTPEPFVADYEEESGTFRVPGREGWGIPPGKYRVAVTERMTREAFEASKPKATSNKPPAITREHDFLGGKFAIENSPIVREIKGASDLVIDMDRPTEG